MPTIHSLHPDFGAEIQGVDITCPLSDAEWAPIWAAFEEHSILLFRGQAMDDASQITFSERFGPLERTISANPAGGTPFARQSNIDMADGSLIPADDRRMIYQKANMLWHSDSSFKTVPSLCSVLSAREVPSTGGNTEFISCRAAWDRLDPAKQAALEGLVVVHSLTYSRGLVDPTVLTDAQKAEVPPVRQALVRANPVNGRNALFIGAHASHIEGMPIEEGRALLAELLAIASPPVAILSHEWQQGDVIVWDNRAALHRATPYDTGQFRRLMQRTTVAGDGPTVAMQGEIGAVSA
jgi:alpha-ketoglutarate-dependent 2,4-dichlorophenoxyacetate dioxygenase